jgi:hypothetical protein
LHHAAEAIVKRARVRQFELFEPLASLTAVPTQIEDEIVGLLAQLLEAMICGAGSRTEDGDEQDQR